MGPLNGFKVVEIAGIGPAPIAAMILADLGAEVILVERKTFNPNAASVDPTHMGKAAFFKRGKRSIALDLKKPESIELVLALVSKADMLIEGFRPGVMERLGLGPEVCFEHNASLVYGRMTGWGQSGPLAQAAGHDLNYASISGALHYCGMPGDKPFPTATLLGDIGGGSMHLALGMVSALLHAQRTGEGQVVDAAICDGTAYMMTLFASLCEHGTIGGERGKDFLTAGSHFCNTYICADNRYVTVQALEPDFYRELIILCGFADDPDFAKQHKRENWPAAKKKMAERFASKTQADWCELLEGSDACFAPVLSLDEAVAHPHNRARRNFLENEGCLQPAPAPKFSKTPQHMGSVPSLGQHAREIMEEIGFPSEKVVALLADETI
jgi:crotonobetainyl-CoA:carnitine CoA-transferase CaiB-like acyl-CoA transferase